MDGVISEWFSPRQEVHQGDVMSMYLYCIYNNDLLEELLDVACPLKINNHILKGLAQAKIIKISVILFRVLNMTIWCKHVHRLELQIFIIFVLRIHQLD